MAVFNGSGGGGTSLATLTQSAGTAQGTFTITGSDTWTGGAINGTGTTTVAVGATMTVSNSGNVTLTGVPFRVKLATRAATGALLAIAAWMMPCGVIHRSSNR